MSEQSERTDWLARLDAVEARLVGLAERDLHGLTSPDAPTGEQWEAGQVWAHLAEFGDYWLDELDTVLAADHVVAFGRVKTDAARVASIERDRTVPTDALVVRVRTSIARLRARLETLADSDWRKVGRHCTLGDMNIDAQLQHFHVGHYEEHADQLEGLA